MHTKIVVFVVVKYLKKIKAILQFPVNFRWSPFKLLLHFWPFAVAKKKVLNFNIDKLFLNRLQLQIGSSRPLNSDCSNAAIIFYQSAAKVIPTVKKGQQCLLHE